MSKNLQVLDLLLVFFLHPHPYHWQIGLVVTNVLVLLEMYTSNLVPILIIKLIKFEIILEYFYLIIISYNSYFVTSYNNYHRIKIKICYLSEEITILKIIKWKKIFMFYFTMHISNLKINFKSICVFEKLEF